MNSALWVGAVSAVMLGACGGLNLQCSTQACNTNASSYKECVEVSGKVDYTIGSEKCSCVSTDTAGCTACVNMISAFCGGTVTDDLGVDSIADAGTDDLAMTNTDSGSSTSCSIVGTFAHTSSSNVMSSFIASGTATAGDFLLDVKTSTTELTATGNYTVSGANISITNTSGNPSANACIGETAVYSLAWDTACANVTFTKVSDACTGRVVDANGSTLTRQ